MLIPSISTRAGGLRDCVLNLSRALQREHHADVNVFSVDDEFVAEDRQSWRALSVYVAPPKLACFRYAPELARKLSSVKADLLHTHGLWTYLSILGSGWAKSGNRKRPYIVSAHGMLDPWALRNSRLKKRLALMLFERRHLERATCLHAVNHAEAAAMRNLGLKNPICVIPNGAEILDSNQELPQPWSSELVNGRKVLLYLGRLHPKKGLPLLFKAWATVAAKGDWILIIAGWDQMGHSAKLQKMALDLNVSASVKFVGPLFGARRAAAYRHADAFVLPSLSEGQPLTVLEAWSNALPVVMTPACNLPEGALIGAAIEAAPSVEALNDGLRKLFLLSGDEREIMGQRALNLVRERFTWEKVATEMRAVYEWLLQKGERPDCISTN